MYKKILVPLDGSELAECVLPHLESIAKGGDVGEVVFLRAVEPLEPLGSAFGGFISAEDVERYAELNKANAGKYLAQLAEKAKYGSAGIKTAVVAGQAAEVVTEYAEKNGVDLIIIATHGRSGVSRWVWGSVAERVLHSAKVPVFVVRSPGCG